MPSPAEELAAKLTQEGRKRPLSSRKVRWHCHLRRLREKLGLQQQDVARAIGCCNSVVSTAERGHEPVLTNAMKLARFFGKSVEELWQPLEPQKNGQDK